MRVSKEQAVAKIEEPKKKDMCAVDTCTNYADVVFTTKKGVKIKRCAFHYQQDADRSRRSAHAKIMMDPEARKNCGEELRQMGKILSGFVYQTTVPSNHDIHDRKTIK